MNPTEAHDIVNKEINVINVILEGCGFFKVSDIIDPRLVNQGWL